VAHVDHPDLFPVAMRLRELHRPAHDEEEILRAFVLQCPRQNLGTGYFSHGRLR
jgi:hypothetical protein